MAVQRCNRTTVPLLRFVAAGRDAGGDGADAHAGRCHCPTALPHQGTAVRRLTRTWTPTRTAAGWSRRWGDDGGCYDYENQVRGRDLGLDLGRGRGHGHQVGGVVVRRLLMTGRRDDDDDDINDDDQLLLLLLLLMFPTTATRAAGGIEGDVVVGIGGTAARRFEAATEESVMATENECGTACVARTASDRAHVRERERECLLETAGQHHVLVDTAQSSRVDAWEDSGADTVAVVVVFPAAAADGP